MALIALTASGSLLAAEITHPVDNDNGPATVLNASNGDFATGDTYTDEGSAALIYLRNNESSIQFCALPAGTVSIAFTAFNIENSADTLSVMGDANGNNNSYTGDLTTSLPPVFESLPGACLTFVFDSDPSLQFTGWVADITLVPPPENIPTLNQWGIIIFAVLLMLFGIRSTRLQKRS